jgi:hypothetical protein
LFVDYLLALPELKTFLSVAAVVVALSPIIRVVHDWREERRREREVRALERIAAVFERF